MAGILEGKVALVTGASSGIGEATALALAQAGAKVAVFARREDRVDALVERITQSGGRALALVGDVSDETDIQNQFEKAHDTFGRLDILINNAGIMLLGDIDGADTSEWRTMMNTNVLGLMYATHAVLPFMKEQGGGHIVNISSVAGRTARAGAGVYNASKWAVNAFSEALRQECVPDNIRVTIIEPGAVATELPSHVTDPTAKEQTDSFYGSITNLASEDIAASILYAVTQPAHVAVNEILIRPTQQLR